MILFLLSALLASGPRAGPVQGAVAPAWEHQFDGGIVDVSAPAGRNCFAVLTTGGVTVMTYAGEVRWRHDLHRVSRVFQAARIAVAPSSCDWVVVLGTSAYRYAWIFRRDGTQSHLGFKGETPLAAAVSPDEQRIAIATGGRRMYLTDAALSVERAVPVDVVRSLDYSPDGTRLLLSGYGHGVASANGTPLWSEHRGVCNISYPNDLAWIVSSCSPPHFSSVGAIAARTIDGVRLWSRAIDRPQVAAAPDGSFIASIGAAVDVRDGREVGGESRFTTLRQDGSTLFEMPAEQVTLLGVTGDRAIVLRAHGSGEWRWYSSRGRLLGTAQIAAPLGAVYTNVISGPRRSYLLVGDATRLVAFAIDAAPGDARN